LDSLRLNLRALLILLQVCTVVVTHKFRGEFRIFFGGGGIPPNSSRINTDLSASCQIQLVIIAVT